MPGTIKIPGRASYVVVKGRRLERGEYGGIVFGGHPQPKVTPNVRRTFSFYPLAEKRDDADESQRSRVQAWRTRGTGCRLKRAMPYVLLGTETKKERDSWRMKSRGMTHLFERIVWERLRANAKWICSARVPYKYQSQVASIEQRNG